MPVERVLSCTDKTLIQCELPDSSIAAFPSWMMDIQVCSQFTEGSPQLSLEALHSLRNFLSDKLSQLQSSSETTVNNPKDPPNEN